MIRLESTPNARPHHCLPVFVEHNSLPYHSRRVAQMPFEMIIVCMMESSRQSGNHDMYTVMLVMVMTRALRRSVLSAAPSPSCAAVCIVTTGVACAPWVCGCETLPLFSVCLVLRLLDSCHSSFLVLRTHRTPRQIYLAIVSIKPSMNEVSHLHRYSS
jgi:hypothetical protein